MLPLGRPFSQGEPERIEQAIALGFTRLWLQEWPCGSGHPRYLDHGTGHDPLLYASYLSQAYGPRGVQLGLSVLNLTAREPTIAARAVVSAQALGGYPLLLGMGTDTKTPESVAQAARDWLTIRSLLHADPSREAPFLLPPGFNAPRMYQSSSKPELWELIKYQAEGWLTTRIHPTEEIEPRVSLLRQHVPNLEVIIQLFCRLDTEDAKAWHRDLQQRQVLQIGKDRLWGLVQLWKSVGVTGIIYYPSEAPTLSQLQQVAEVILGS